MNDPAPTIVLASRSPRRRELLAQIGLAFRLADIEVDESHRPGEAPTAYVERLARAKAGAGIGAASASEAVLGADTVVTVDDGAVLGKPRDEAHALEMLVRLSGRSHEVHTGVAVARAGGIASAVVTSRVHLRAIEEAEGRAYWASGEPRGKAGAYAIQGLGAVFVARLEGSYSNVVGLPLFETVQLLRRFGIDPLQPGAESRGWP